MPRNNHHYTTVSGRHDSTAPAAAAVADSETAPPLAVAEVYNTDRFGQLYAQSRAPPLANLGLAANFLLSLFRYRAIPLAFLGGWAVYLRGSGRVTTDVDVTVDSDMNVLEAVLLRERRVCIPQVHGPTSIQIFVHTGSAWDPPWPDTTEYTVSVDIILRGHLGTPADLHDGTESMRPIPATPHGSRPVPVVSLFYQLASKFLAHYNRRRETGNDYADLAFLVLRYPEQVWSYRDLFIREHVQLFCDDFASDPSYTADHIRFVTQLLGLDVDDRAIQDMSR